MKPFEKVNVKTAIPQKFAHFDLSCNHVTTQKFMSSRPIYYRQLVPKQSIKLNMETLCRMEALPVPTFGKCDIISRAFFVPYRVVFPAWSDFYVQTIHSFANGNSGFQSCVPYITQKELSKFIKLHSSVSDSSHYDFKSGADYWLIDADFRSVYCTLVSLGYNILCDDDDDVEGVRLSALNLLCYLRVMCDWYFPSQFATSQTINALQEVFKSDLYADRFGKNFTAQDLEYWLPLFNVCAYDNDYFTSAWENPVGPISGTTPQQSILDNSIVDGLSVQSGSTSGTPFVINNVPGSLSDYALSILRRMTSYMRRFNLVGSRAIDRMYSLFGVNLAPEKMNRSVYIDSFTQNIDVFDVMSNADSGNAQLGDYAGKGFSYGRGLNIDYKTDEFGIILIINSIVPRVGYTDGYDRDIRQLYALDFFNGTYDSCGVRVIEKGELCTHDKDFQSFHFEDLLTAFGYTPQYSEYKFSKDRMSGNFKLFSERASLGSPSWHLNRQINVQAYSDLVHSLNFVLGKDSSQYQRIFYSTQDVDNFTLIHHFNVDSTAPMKSLYDSLDFEHEADNQSVTMDNNGPKMN